MEVKGTRLFPFWAVSFGPCFMKFTHNVKDNKSFQIMSKTEKRQKYIYIKHEEVYSLQRYANILAYFYFYLLF